MSGFDWGSVEEPEEKYVKFNVGTSVHGVISQIGSHNFGDGVDHPQLTLLVDAGGERIVTASTVDLLRQLKENRPQIGDTITITCFGEQPLSGGRSMKQFNVDVASPGDRPRGHIRPVDPPAAPDDTEPF